MHSATNRLFRDDAHLGRPHPARAFGADAAPAVAIPKAGRRSAEAAEAARWRPAVAEDEDDDYMFDNMPV